MILVCPVPQAQVKPEQSRSSESLHNAVELHLFQPTPALDSPTQNPPRTTHGQPEQNPLGSANKIQDGSFSLTNDGNSLEVLLWAGSGLVQSEPSESQRRLSLPGDPVTWETPAATPRFRSDPGS